MRGPQPTRDYYHRTYPEAAAAIMEGGFKDVSETFETGSAARGVWFTDSLASASSTPSAFGSVVVAVTLPLPIAEGHFHTDDQGYREYLIPAIVLNSYPRKLLQGS